MFLTIKLGTLTCIDFHPGRVELASSRASNMLLIEEDTLGFCWEKGPKSYPENYVLMLNWIVWNRTDCLHKNGFGVE